MPPVAEARLSIDAPIEVVWRALTDVAGYPGWNPFVVRVDGPAATLGDRFLLHVRWVGGGATTAGETLTTLDAPTVGADGVSRATFAYRFTEPLATFNLVRATRTQTLEQAPGGPTLYHSHEGFTGLFAAFVPLVRVRAGMDAMAAALKAHAEASVPREARA